MGSLPTRPGIFNRSNTLYNPPMDKQRRFINQLMPGETLDQVFLVRDKDLRTTKSGGLYVSCTLADKTGTLSGRMWQASEAIYNSIPADGFLQAKGRTEDYKGTLQFIIDACRPISADKVDLGDYLPVTQYDIEGMWAELIEILRTVQNKPLRMLVKKFVEDQAFVTAYKKAPAAMQMHHPFIGGLLEHTLGIARAAVVLLPLYPQLNADLVLASVFFHDMAKTSEMSSDLAITYTDRGQLVGHLVDGAIWLAEKAKLVAEDMGKPFPQKTLDLLQHILLAHHGVHEYGSPKLPAVGEAFLLHYLDNLDAKMFMVRNAIANDPDPNASFTSYIRAIETRVYKSADTLEE